MSIDPFGPASDKEPISPSPLTGEGIADSALAEPSGAESDAQVRYPQTADSVSNVSAHRGEGGFFIPA